MTHLDPADQKLIAQLRDMLAAIDSPPEALVEAAKASLAWRTIDAELATLVSDSAMAAGPTVRSFEPPRVLTFETADTMLVIEIAKERRVRRVLGQVIEPGAGSVEIRHADGVMSVTADELGRFKAAPVPDGPLSITCRFDDPDRKPLVTSWITV
ncbi:MAG TPA: hypothetical protein VFQ15_06970 [Jiangellaceae bacterium]|nr:hypothetical protein [Jiangellaceae bacterium]